MPYPEYKIETEFERGKRDARFRAPDFGETAPGTDYHSTMSYISGLSLTDTPTETMYEKGIRSGKADAAWDRHLASHPLPDPVPSPYLDILKKKETSVAPGGPTCFRWAGR
jgi:hypothetical protein